MAEILRRYQAKRRRHPLLTAAKNLEAAIEQDRQSVVASAMWPICILTHRYNTNEFVAYY